MSECVCYFPIKVDWYWHGMVCYAIMVVWYGMVPMLCYAIMVVWYGMVRWVKDQGMVYGMAR